MSALGSQLRPFQAELADDPSRFIVAVIHRRAGKTVEALDWLLDDCREQDDGSTIRNYYLCPFRNQAKAVAWDFLLQMTADDDVTARVSELQVEFPNGSRLQLLGADGYDKHRGRGNVSRVAFDETAQIPPGCWREVFRPMIADTKGRALFIGTPRGRQFLWELYQLGIKGVEGWSSHLATVEDTGLIEPDEVAALKSEMTTSEFRREFMCDWDIGAPGAFFSHEMDQVQQSYRVQDGELHDPNELVHTSWALLPGDAFAVCYWQMLQGRPTLIDAHRYLQERVDLVVKDVLAKRYAYDSHCFRIDQHVAADTVPFRLGAIRRLGIRGPVMPRREWIDEVHVLRQFIAQAVFSNEAGGDAVEGLRQVRAEWYDDSETFGDKPVRDWCYDFAVAISAFAAHAKRGRIVGRRDPIDYPEEFRA